jgi:bifunctional non-homologous end joining protein LigD
MVKRSPSIAKKPDPMPARIEPCLALLVQRPPVGSVWTFEVKWDGYRLAVHKEPAGVRILTRGGHDWTERFPAIADAVQNLRPSTVILDGEAVVLDHLGRSDFGLLQQALGGRGGKRLAGKAIFVAFDMLYLEGHDLTRMPLCDRRRMLEALLDEAGSSAIRFSEDIGTDGASLLKSACAMGIEGIIGKDETRPYRSGRHGEWVKVKCIQSEGFVIVGYERSTVAFGGIGRLLMAAHKGDGLVYVGGVGTGFNERSATALRRQLDLLVIDRPAVPMRRRKAVYVAPRLVAEIEYRGWTHDGKLRHASYKGLRETADADDVCQVAPRHEP